MKTSAEGRAEIKQREGVVLSAYPDSAGILTIGVGHTSAAGAPTVYKGMKITAAQADEILSRDLALFDLATDSKLRACDLVQLRVRDVAHGDRVAARAIVMRQKTQRPVQFEITKQTRDAVRRWIERAKLKPET